MTAACGNSKKYNNTNRDNIKVAVRVRPLISRREFALEKNNRNATVKMNKNSVILSNRYGRETTFTYDYAFWSFDKETKNEFASQETVFNALGKPLLDNVFQGYNVCLFAYGQTNSGYVGSLI